MSVYQYVYFAAVDKPLDDKQLEYMRRQSTRAEVTRWQFQNEYHFGDFHGNSLEMMRRGYDVHLHYANYGVRKLLFRLPMGLPLSAKQFKAYAMEYSIEWKKDKRGKGGVLSIQPECDAGFYSEGYFSFERMVACLPKIREGLMTGDTRVLYLGWLACNWDEESLEPPVPAGLGKLPPELAELIDFYELDSDLLAAANEQSPQLPGQAAREPDVDDWLANQSPETLRVLMRRVLRDDAVAVRAEVLAAMRNQSSQPTWPVSAGSRTLEALREQANIKADQRKKREIASEKRKREKRLAKIRSDPDSAISGAEKLIQSRSTENYAKAAKMLAELRDAVGGDKGSRMADQAAGKIAKKYPTLSYAKRAFKEQGLNYR
ncbi:hypothetical protein [Aporhodopirellula aestuarii]|uniref:Transposase n=1 Tax=Aporhodopirellula aestuarii TaxID=2950107 RepID=A0ABT0UC15_9BACT|nr:hypothetical protein [Aporhodopirellula aestuarii]MCM2374562.1 hypothetical protein [Aporhodopirellula aestuarii]